MKAFRAICLFLTSTIFLVAQEPTPHPPSWNDGTDVEHHWPQPARIRGGPDWLSWALVEKPAPEHPQNARGRKLRGSVKLLAIVGQDGTVRRLDTLSGNPILAKAAIDAVQHWKFSPTYLNGEKVEVRTTLTIDFDQDKQNVDTSKKIPHTKTAQ